MLRSILLVGACLLPVLAIPASAAEVLIDGCREPQAWGFHPGSEFPGARGGLGVVADDAPAEGGGLALAYDFAGGGSYVAAEFRGPLPPAISGFTIACTAAQPTRVVLRLRDAGGRIFQGAPRDLPAGAVDLELACAGPWAQAWGGQDGAAPGAAAGIQVLVQHATDRPAQGRLVLRRLSASSSADAAALAEPLTLPDPDFDLLGWRVAGTWLRQWRRPLLLATARGGADAELSVTLARPGRDWTARVALRAGTVVPLRLAPPLAEAVAQGRYRLVFSASADGRSASADLPLHGVASDPRLLGAPQVTSALPPSIFGTCVHLSYGWKPNGSFASWAPYERLLDEAAACGLGWVRDGVTLVRGTDGTWTIDPRDVLWLRAAKARGLRTIVVLWMEAAEMRADLCARAAALATAADLVDVIELGNEPYNFGGWLKRHGGTWNAKEADGGTSPWLKEFTAASNAAAEAAKAARPAVTVVGLGCLPPANARALALGASPAIDGVTDHPYSPSLPPEVVPWGAGFAARDGLGSGDAAGTTAGMFVWYRERLAAADAPGRTRNLWLTEFGWPTNRQGAGNAGGLFAGIDEATQAAYLVRRHLLHLWLGMAASVQYDLLDDYGSEVANPEANFGLLRGDCSRKPAWHATQRLCSLFAGALPLRDGTVTVVKAPLHRSQRPGVAVAGWDGNDLRPQDGVRALPFARADQPGTRLLAVWSELPPGTGGGREAVIRIAGWSGYGAPLAIGLVSGRQVPVPSTREGGDLLLTVTLDDEPLAVRLFMP